MYAVTDVNSWTMYACGQWNVMMKRKRGSDYFQFSHDIRQRSDLGKLRRQSSLENTKGIPMYMVACLINSGSRCYSWSRAKTFECKYIIALVHVAKVCATQLQHDCHMGDRWNKLSMSNTWHRHAVQHGETKIGETAIMVMMAATKHALIQKLAHAKLPRHVANSNAAH